MQNKLNHDLFLQNIIINNSDNLRALQSIAFHLHLHSSVDINISKSDAFELKNMIFKHLSVNKHLLEDECFKRVIGVSKIDSSQFDFLRDYTKGYILHSIFDWGFFGFSLLASCFERDQSIGVIVGYALDNSSLPKEELIYKLKMWRKSLDQMKIFSSRAKWFNSSERLEAAKYVFLKRGQERYLEMLYQNSEVFFLDEKINAYEKELLFREVRARHNLLVSRKSNPKRQCNFSLNTNSYKLMEKLRKNSNLNKSEFIEMIFSPEHEATLLELIDLKKNSFKK